MAKGSVGTATSVIVHRRQKPVPCNCSKCRNFRLFEGQAICMSSGDVLVRSKTTCLHYSGPFIYRKKKAKKAVQKKVNPKKQTKKQVKRNKK